MSGPEELKGRSLGDFVVRHRIGEGGFGTVYRAEQPALGREAVIKVLHTRHRASKTAIQRFLREARLASKLDHPYAAHIYAFGVEPDGLIWIAMEYVRGRTLHEVLREHGPMAIEELVPLLDRICEVLQAAHDLGIVHRDIKPANVMVVQRSGRMFPKLLDFGIAKLTVDDVVAPSAEAERPPVPPGEHTMSMAGEPPAPRAITASGALAETMELPAPAPTPPSPGDPTLTEAGAAMGSPPYMAPEQWDDSAAATARTDLYALGILTYEALTGRRPFTDGPVAALARDHASAPVPRLGPRFPPALDDVMAKVLAKQAGDRHASAMAFAAELRAAAGLGVQPLPALDDDLRIAVEASFPQPIAEAVAAYHAARNPHQARDALREIVTTSIRFVALVALAAHAQVRTGASAVLDDAVRELRKHALSDEAWLALARELVRPFAATRRAHPVPELVSVLLPDGDDDVMATSAIRPSADPDALAVVRATLPEVARLLRALAFLADYRLVVVDGGRAESWMGLRRPRRIAVELGARPVEPGQPVLIDAANRPLLSLWPLVQTSSPLLGAPPELFLLDGRGRRGTRMVALPHALERHDDQIWDWLGAQISDAGADPPISSEGGRRPYLGLAAFGPEDAGSFVGREREIDAAVNRLIGAPVIAVVGPSGAGKSSFVHAGLVPALPRDWTVVVLRPGATPIATLEARLRRAGIAATDLASDPGALGALLHARDGTTVLVVDQLEELFTLGASDDDQRRFVQALLAAARSADDRVRVVITLRDDFLARATRLPELRDRLPAALFLLGTPSRAELLRILTEPLARHGFELEDPALGERIVREVADTPGALALLSFTALELWELRDRQFRQLTRRAYEALGGVAGALAQHAEATLAAMTAGEQRLARIVLGHLVTADGTRAVLSRGELHQLAGDPAAPGVLEKLIAARLLAATETDGGDDRIELVHEALIVAWPRLAGWRREDAEGARLRDQIRAAARPWVERDRPRGLLWRDDALVELQLWRARHPEPMTDADEAFIAASLAEARRGRRWRRGLLAAVLGAMALAVAVLIWARDQAAEQREAAREAAARDHVRYLGEVVERARQAILDGRGEQARDAIAEATQLGAEPTPSFRLLAATAAESRRALVATLHGHRNAVLSAEFDGDGGHLLTGGSDGEARLWDTRTGEAAVTLTGCQGKLWGARFDPARTRIATRCSDGLVRVYSAAGALERAFEATEVQGGNFFVDAQFIPGARQLATVARSSVRLWDLDTGARIWTAATTGGVDQERMAVSDDGALLASVDAARDGQTSVWSVATGALARRLPTGYAPWIEFDRTGTQLLAASIAPQVARLWDVRDGRVIRSLVGHSGWVDRAQLSPDGVWIATAARDHTVRIWRAGTGELAISLPVGAGVVTALAFDARHRLLAGTSDGIAILWDLATTTHLATFEARRGLPLRAVAFSPDGSLIATAGDDAVARLWSPTATGVRAVLPAGDRVFGALFARGDRALYTFGDDHRVRLWDPRTGASQRELAAGGLVEAAVVVPRDGALVFGDSNGDVVRWDGDAAPRTVAHHTGVVRGLAVSPDGALVASGAADGDVVISELAGGATVARLGGHDGYVWAVAFSPDGQTLATGDARGHVWTWRLDGTRIASLAGHTDWISAMTFTRDGRLITVSGDTTGRVWSPTGALEHVLAGHAAVVNGVALDAAERRVVTTSIDNTARIWDLATGREVVKLQHPSFVTTAAFSPDGELVVTGGDDPIIRIWDARSGRELSRLDGHTGLVWRIRFSDDGLLSTAGFDGKAVLWRLPR